MKEIQNIINSQTYLLTNDNKNDFRKEVVVKKKIKKEKKKEKTFVKIKDYNQQKPTEKKFSLFD